MPKDLKKLMDPLEEIALKIVMLEPGDIPALGDILKDIENLQHIIEEEKIEENSIRSIVNALKEYVEKLILFEKEDLSPFSNGVKTLQHILRDLEMGRKIGSDMDKVLKELGYKAEDKKEEEVQAEKLEEVQVAESQRRDIGDEEKDIVYDFISESLDTLSEAEVKILDLEDNPEDMDSINALFRAFHTIKGVSGFLNFSRINSLSHITENLLDMARNREMALDAEIIDTILESVDALRGMIENIKNTIDSGHPSEGDKSYEELINKIKMIIERAEKQKDKPLGEILKERGLLKEEDIEEALNRQKEESTKRIGEILVEDKKVPPKEVISALRDQKRSGKWASLQIKVETEKLDNLIDMVGELVIAQSMLKQHQLSTKSKDRKFDQIINQLNQISSGLQRTAMSLRMVPIKHTFQKMLRLVRDLSKKSGKEVELVMTGEDTEIDRNMVEEIYEPMVHMIRNSIDHGIEAPEERENLDKPRKGTIYLKAYHKGGNIVIEIEDDGRGLDTEKILKKAIADGIVTEDQRLTELEIYDLIFQPGLSTAEKVTDVSGRGVGMDVVKNTVEKLRGKVDVKSWKGKGTRFYIRLPLTLAIIDGMITRVDEERFIIPTLNVQETFKPSKEHYHTIENRGEMIMVRDTLLPLVRLKRLLGLDGGGRPENPWDKLMVVVENQQRLICLMVDELLGREEVVIKSLGGWLKNVKGVAGGAILGDGRVGLILDVAGIFDLALGR